MPHAVTMDMTESRAVMNAVARHRRYGRIETFIVGALCLLLALGGIFATVAFNRQGHLIVGNDRIVCIVEHLADFNRAEADALAAEPGSPQRETAAARLRTEADRLNRACG